MLDESTRAAGEPLWRQGNLSDEEFERAALAIRPSWEVGLDAAKAAPEPAAEVIDRDLGAFKEPSAAARAALVDVAADPAPAPVVAAKPAEKKPVEAKPALPVEVEEPRAKPSTRPAPRPFNEPPALEREPPKKSNKGLWAAGIARPGRRDRGLRDVGLLLHAVDHPESTPPTAAAPSDLRLPRAPAAEPTPAPRPLSPRLSPRLPPGPRPRRRRA
ncbi:MAG: hypothetical protein R3A52_18000 [Polyangiales bacterium]